MWLLLVTLVGVAAVLLTTRGSLTTLAKMRVTAGWLLVLGLAIQAALEYLSLPKSEIETVGYSFLMVSYGLMLAFCVANLSTRGFGVILIGVAMNALVIGLNQGMPTKPIGNDSHGNRVYKPVEQTVKHRQERNDDLLGFLGDRILFPRPLDTLVSFGDLVIAVGICELVYYASRRKAPSMAKPEDEGRPGAQGPVRVP
jgi:Family of unknown function (DUF5317)